MHARIDELLALRDSALDKPNLSDHVRQCALCSARLQELISVREQLRRWPLIEAPEGAFAAIANRLSSTPSADMGRPPASQRNVRMRRAVFLAAAAGMSAIALVVTLRPNDEGADSPIPAEVAEQGEAHSVAHLIQQSRELESMLQTLPRRPSVEQVSTAATLDTIEARIEWLDLRLSNPGEGDLSETQAHRLWRERVELMDSFVKVRYAQSGHAVF